MTADKQDYIDPNDQLRRLIERSRTDELGPGDVAVIRSTVQQIRDPEVMNSLLGEAFESQPFLEAVSDMIQSGFDSWPRSTLIRLTESLLFLGLDRKAAVIADELRHRAPGDVETIRLWALSAGTPEATIRRFVAALSDATNPSAVISDAREFARKNFGGELSSIIEEAAALRQRTDRFP